MIDPACQKAIDEYPELQAVVDATSEERATIYKDDVYDAQHEWLMTIPPKVFQNCYRCGEQRRTPLRDLPPETQVWIVQEFLKKTVGSA